MQFRLHARLFRLPYLNASPFVRPSPMFPIFQKETEGINSIHFLLIYRDRFFRGGDFPISVLRLSGSNRQSQTKQDDYYITPSLLGDIQRE
jgi:hypothetical protein